MKRRIGLLSLIFLFFFVWVGAQKQLVQGVVVDEYKGRPAMGSLVFAFDSLNTLAPVYSDGSFELETSSDVIKIQRWGYKTTVFTSPFPDTFYIRSTTIVIDDNERILNRDDYYLSLQSQSESNKPYLIQTQQGEIKVTPLKESRNFFNTDLDWAYFPKKRILKNEKKRLVNVKSVGLDYKSNPKKEGDLILSNTIDTIVPNENVKQKQLVQGVVVDEKNEALFGATVYFPQDSYGLITDERGKFSVQSDGDYFIVSYVGFVTDTIQKPFPDIIKMKIDNEVIFSEGVIVVASKYLTPHSFTSLDRKKIDRLPTITLQDIYNEVPGIYMHSGALNTNRLTIRGIGARSPFSTQKLRAFINDIPITNGIGESNLEDINLGIIDNIDIVKGPAAPEYGSALGGTLLYNTSRALRQKDEIRALFEYGSFNTFHGNVNANYSLGKTMFSLNQDYISSNGFRDHNQVNRYNLSGFSSTEWGENELTVFINHTNLRGEIPSSLNSSDFSESPSSAAANWEAANGGEAYNRQMIGVNYVSEFQEKLRLSRTAFYSRFSSDERRPFNTAEINSNNYGGRLLMRYGLSDQVFHIESGLEFFLDNEGIDLYETEDEGRGDLLSDNFENRYIANGFVQGHLPWRDFMLELGFSVNSIFYRFNREELGNTIDLTRFYTPLVLPHFSVSYRPSYRYLFYFNLSTGSTSPSLQSSQDPLEFFTSNLLRETGVNAELGSRLNIKNGVEFDASIYTFWVNNLVILENVGPDIFQAINAGRTRHPGIELSANKIWNTNAGDFGVRSSYQFTPHRYVRFTNNTSVVDGNFLPGNPQQKLHAEITYQNKYFSGLIQHQFVGETFANDENTLIVDDYQVTNVRLESKDINLRKSKSRSPFKTRIYLQLNNIFDAEYASMVAVNPSSFGGALPRYLYPGLPRNFTLGVSVIPFKI